MKKRLFKTLLGTMAVMGVILFAGNSSQVKAEEYHYPLKPVTITDKETLDYDYAVRHRLEEYNAKADYDVQEWEMTNDGIAAYESQTYFSIEDKSYLNIDLKGHKPGTVTLEYKRENSDGDKCYFTIQINVVSASSRTKTVASKAKSFLKGKSSKKTFLFKDVTGDGVKDIIYDGRIYYWNFDKNKFSKYDGMGDRKIVKVYKNKKGVLYFKTKGTIDKKGYPKDENKRYVKYAYLYVGYDRIVEENVCQDLGFEEIYVELTKKGRKYLKLSGPYAQYYRTEDTNCIEFTMFDKTISKSKFASFKKGLTSLGGFHKNTSANRKKYLK